MLEVALSIVYVGFLIITMTCLFLKKSYFLLSFLCLMGVSPTAQYLVYDGTGDQYFTTTFQRLTLEFINILILLFYICFHKLKPIRGSASLNLLAVILFLWNTSHFVNIINGIDMQRSLIFYLISVFGPTVFLYYIIHDRTIKLTSEWVGNTIYMFSTFFYGIGIVFILYRFSKDGIFMNPRTAGSIYLSNFSINLMALFAPLVFIKHKVFDKRVRFMKGFYGFGLLINQLFAVSRLGMVIYLLVFLYLRITNFKTFLKTIFSLLLIAIITYYFILFYFELDMIEVIKFRFVGYEGAVSENTANDERFRIWIETAKYIRFHPEYWLTGIGISNFRLVDPDVLMYSNAHNLFLNILFERGVFILGIFMAFLLHTWYISRRVLKAFKNSPDSHYLLRSIWVGILLYLFISTLYNDLFTASGQQSGMFAYFFFFSVGILYKANEEYRKGRNIPS